MFSKSLFEMLVKFVLVSAACWAVGWWYLLILKVVKDIIYRRKKARGRQMVAAAKKRGPFLMTNEVYGTTAICFASDFSTFASQNLEPWLGRRAKILPTFAVCDDENLRTKFHVSVTKEQGRELECYIIHQLTGFLPSQVDGPSWEETRKILVRKNSRLFVPFKEGTTEEETDQLVKFYGASLKTTFAEMKGEIQKEMFRFKRND